ncbi:hypothetical protein BU14_0049s0002 [Porphyra umbilicalis]|uniref:Uncharacterized protein n=1 Tax=Porphyra umbilicalis TaxID=2786 RepID=A0A1X6PIN7_PORUM|nr:hypothetical protein BU14_0049s0002 [Porphyra umbilicalis]|eukprot:OSX80558.1 hypothetical protein BU14_0049s0002 [Porphyra umbilicalis]
MAGGGGSNGPSPTTSSSSVGGGGGGSSDDVQGRLKALNVTLLARLKAAESKIAELTTEVGSTRDEAAAANAKPPLPPSSGAVGGALTKGAAATGMASPTTVDEVPPSGAGAAAAGVVGMLGGLSALAGAARSVGGDEGGEGLDGMLGHWMGVVQGWARALETAVGGLWEQVTGLLSKVVELFPGGNKGRRRP